MKLYHYTCSDGFAGILRDGFLRPCPQLQLGSIPLVWLTDLDSPDRAALGLTSYSLRCDRTEHRIEVDVEAVHWPVFARERVPSVLRRLLERSKGARPMHWYVSEARVPVLLGAPVAAASDPETDGGRADGQ